MSRSRFSSYQPCRMLPHSCHSIKCKRTWKLRYLANTRSAKTRLLLSVQSSSFSSTTSRRWLKHLRVTRARRRSWWRSSTKSWTPSYSSRQKSVRSEQEKIGMRSCLKISWRTPRYCKSSSKMKFTSRSRNNSSLFKTLSCARSKHYSSQKITGQPKHQWDYWNKSRNRNLPLQSLTIDSGSSPRS